MRIPSRTLSSLVRHKPIAMDGPTRTLAMALNRVAWHEAVFVDRRSPCSWLVLDNARLRPVRRMPIAEPVPVTPPKKLAAFPTFSHSATIRPTPVTMVKLVSLVLAGTLKLVELAAAVVEEEAAA